jgi:glycosyltransferase involved in cell wall biosynthesis
LRILIVKPVLPWPPNQGTKRVTVSLIRALAGEHEVTLVAPLLSRAEAGRARELEEALGCRVVSRLAPNRRSAFHRAWYKAAYGLQSLVGHHSPRSLYSSPGDLMEVAASLTRTPADLAIFEYWYTYRWMNRVGAKRKVLLAHDAEFSVNRLAGALAGGSPRSLWEKNETRREVEACRSVDQIWTLTDADAEALASASQLPRSRFVTMPFGVDTVRLNLPAGGGGDNVLFFGSFDADFNRDALRHLVEAIWPRILEVQPDARLVVAGGGLPESLRRLVEAAGGRYLGEVADIRELHASAAVVVIPLRFGGGLRIRLLEALACSRAVVATPVAVAGMAGRDGVHYRVRSEPREFADAVTDLLSRPLEASRLGSKGRQLVEEVYSEDRAAERILSMLREVVSIP